MSQHEPQFQTHRRHTIIMGQAASNCWAKSRNLGQPGTIFVLRPQPGVLCAGPAAGAAPPHRGACSEGGRGGRQAATALPASGGAVATRGRGQAGGRGRPAAAPQLVMTKPPSVSARRLPNPVQFSCKRGAGPSSTPSASPCPERRLTPAEPAGAALT